MKLFKPFGPSIGKVELKKTIIGNVNDYCDKVMASKLKSKKLDHSSKLIGNVEQQFIITRSNFKKILEGKIKQKKQKGKILIFKKKDLLKYDKLFLNKRYKLIDLIKINNARTFKNKSFNFFNYKNKKYSFNIKIKKILN